MLDDLLELAIDFLDATIATINTKPGKIAGICALGALVVLLLIL